MNKNTPDHVMTDHALIRYIERVLGGNINDMKDAATPKVVADAVKTGATSIKYKGITYVIRDGRITTVVMGKRGYHSKVDFDTESVRKKI